MKPLSRFTGHMGTRLFVLFLIVLAPLLAYDIYREASLHSRLVEQKLGRLQGLTATIRYQHEVLFTAARDMLFTLSAVAEVRGGDTDACSRLLSGIKNAYDRYSALAKVDADGRVVCSSDRLDAPIDVSWAQNIRQAFKTGEFTVSRFMIGPVSGKPVIVVTKPLLDGERRVFGTVSAGLALEWLQDWVATVGEAQDGVRITLVDDGGRVVAKYPSEDVIIGQTAIYDPLVADVVGGRRGEFVYEGDGTPRLVSAGVVESVPGGIHIIADMAEENIFAGLRRDQLFRIGVVLALVMVSVVAAWRASERLILSWTRRLSQLAGALGAGDFTARFAGSYGHSEMGQLARTLDTMAAHLQTRDARLRDALRESESRFGALFEQVQDTLLLIDTDGVIKDVNPAGCQLLGCDREALIGRPCQDVLRAVDLADIIGQGDRAERVQVTLLAKDGRSLPAEAVRSWASVGGRRFLLLACRDMSVYFSTVELLRRREGILQAVRIATDLLLRRQDWHAAMPVLLESMGRALNVTWFFVYEARPDEDDIALVNLFEWTSEDGSPLAMSERFKTLSMKRLRFGAMMEALQQGASYTLKARESASPLAADLAAHGCETVLLAPVFVSGRFWGLVGLGDGDAGRVWGDPSRDGLRSIAQSVGAAIERTETERALRVREERMRALTHSIRDALFAVDDRGNVVTWNEGAEVLFGTSPAHALGRSIDTFITEPENILSHLPGRGQGMDKPLPVTARRSNGRIFHGELTAGTWRQEDRLYYSLVLRDITERLETDRLLRQAQKSEALGNLASGIAHDFNNMLVPIVALTDLVMEDLPEDDPNRPRLQRVVDAANKASELVARILMFTRDNTPQMVPIDMGPALRDMVSFLQSMVPSSIKLEVAVIREPGMVAADCGQLQAVVMNLAVNAVDAIGTRPGQLTYTLDRVVPDAAKAAALPGLEAGRPYALIRVKDDGDGMDEKTLARVFDAFFTTKPVGKGTGLGLAMAQDVVTKHGGVITVRSMKGRGTTFEIYLPVHTGPSPGATDRNYDADKEAAVAAAGEVGRGAGRGGRQPQPGGVH